MEDYNPEDVVDFRNVKLGIALPLTNQTTYTRFTLTFYRMWKPPQHTLLFPTMPISEYAENIATIRNHLVRQAMEADCTHLLMMDTDQTYPIDLIVRLFSHKKKVVHAKVHRGYEPFDPILMRGNKDDGYTLIDDKEWADGGLVEVDAIGSGCVLYDMDVFLDVEFPWFENLPAKNDTRTGEDIGLCHKIRAAGYKIYVDCDVDVGHLKLLEVNANTYWAVKTLNQFANLPEDELEAFEIFRKCTRQLRKVNSGNNQ